MTMEQRSNYTMEQLSNYIEYLKKGVSLNFAQLPPTDKTACLLEDLKRGGFVSTDTRIEHFRVLFGIPLHFSSTPFEPIKWRKNKQLLRYFLCTLYSKEDTWTISRICYRLIADKHGTAGFMPQSDKKRLEQSSDFEILVKLLNRFNE